MTPLPPSTPPILAIPPKPLRPKGSGVGARDLRKLSKQRLKEAQLLLTHDHFAGAMYLCGYAIESALKARICTLLKWPEYKVTRGYESFKTHDLAILLELSGRKQKIQAELFGEWSAVQSRWGTLLRYTPVSDVSKKNAEEVINATMQLLRAL